MMSSEFDPSKLDISKNLLQMNFMKRTLIAKEKSEFNLKEESLTLASDFQFVMSDSVMKKLSERLTMFSNRPIVRHAAGSGRLKSIGLRASYNGFNPYLSEDKTDIPVPKEEKDEKRKSFGPKTRKLLAGIKRHSTGEALNPDKKSKRKRSL